MLTKGYLHNRNLTNITHVSEEATERSNSIASSSEKLSQLAHELRDHVAKFKCWCAEPCSKTVIKKPDQWPGKKESTNTGVQPPANASYALRERNQYS